MAKNAKKAARVKIIEYLANPDHEFVNRSTLATRICKYKKSQYLYQVFTVDELDQIEKEALEIRRKKYARFLAFTDHKLFEAIKDKNVAAIKLAYQRFEGWTEKGEIGFSGDLNFASSLTGESWDERAKRVTLEMRQASADERARANRQKLMEQLPDDEDTKY